MEAGGGGAHNGHGPELRKLATGGPVVACFARKWHRDDARDDDDARLGAVCVRASPERHAHSESGSGTQHNVYSVL